MTHSSARVICISQTLLNIQSNGSFELQIKVMSPQALNILRVTAFFVIGILLTDHIRTAVPPIAWGLGIALATLLYFLFRKKDTLASVILFSGALLLGAFIMSIDWQRKLSDIESLPTSSATSYSAVVTSKPVYKIPADSTKSPHHVCDIVTVESSVKLKAYVYTSSPIALGDTLVCSSRFKPIPQDDKDNKDDGSSTWHSYLLRHGYAATTSISDKNLVIRKASADAMPLRDKLLNIILPRSGDSEDAIISAMILGDKSQLTAEIKSDYSNAGASHVLALSGLHLTIILSILTIFLAALPKVAACLIKLLFVWGFAFLVGMPVSLVRVCLMFTLLIISDSFRLERAPINSLSIAAIIILVFSPQSLFDISFQLSFTAVAAITIATGTSDRIAFEHFIHPPFYIRVPSNLLLVSFAAQLGTLPLILYHFGQFPTYFLLTNLFVGFFATLILALGIFALVFCWWPWLLSFIHEALTHITSWLNSLTHTIATLPHATITDININIPQAILIYILIGLLVLPICLPKSH